MNKSQIFHWILFNLILVGLLVGLIFETIRDGYSWYFAASAAFLIFAVNFTIYRDKFVNVGEGVA